MWIVQRLMVFKPQDNSRVLGCTDTSYQDKTPVKISAPTVLNSCKTNRDFELSDMESGINFTSRS